MPRRSINIDEKAEARRKRALQVHSSDTHSQIRRTFSTRFDRGRSCLVQTRYFEAGVPSASFLGSDDIVKSDKKLHDVIRLANLPQVLIQHAIRFSSLTLRHVSHVRSRRRQC